ncbi:MAG: hypothetical protein IT464_10250 [Planctomycetes bacterium]|nr:hypothetical protein [Planctomycetota bacterium]
MKPSAKTELENLLPGLPFWSNHEFSQLLKSLPDNAPPKALRALLAQAADRLGSALNAPKYRVVNYRLTNASKPTQWDGELVAEEGDGSREAFFVRYTNGSLKLYIDDIMVEYIEVEDASDPDTLPIERAAQLLARVLFFPSIPGAKLQLLQ